MTEDFTQADPDLDKGHPLLVERWGWLEKRLRDKYSFKMQVIEVYRPELRQQWLYGQGRTVGQLQPHGISFAFARPRLKIVTNAWSARVSAHGTTRKDGGLVLAAAAALDVVPVGLDRVPWTDDDPWDAFVIALAVEGPTFGLVHFHSRRKEVTDRPHLQLYPEWSDVTHLLTV